MAAARLSRDPHQIRPRVQLRRIRLHPADRIVNVGQRRRITVTCVAEIDRRHGEASTYEPLPIDLAFIQIAIAPGAAVHLDNSRERSLSLRLEQPGHELAIAM